ncbi:hypothetical protein B0T17DRAFT_484614, partial [Bombardia bombarda]
AQWSWPADMDPQVPNQRQPRATSSSSSTAEEPQQPANNHNHNTEQTPSPEQPRPASASPKRRIYKPRTCRICLEVVNPTTDIDDSIAAGLFTSRSRVRYVSEDPELGRLLCPCNCKGSQKYVHEGCLQAWRQSAPFSDRHYYQCPTCGFQYRMARLKWSSWLSSTLIRVAMTVLILLATVFVLGFIADPIINLWLDPMGGIIDTIADVVEDVEALQPPVALHEDPSSWSFHFLKGFFSLGLLGFFKSFLAVSPWQWFSIRGGTFGGRRRRAATGRARLENINLFIVVVGVLTFLGAAWKLVNHLSARALEKVSDRIIDVQGDDPDEYEEVDDEGPAPESRKDQ